MQEGDKFQCLIVDASALLWMGGCLIALVSTGDALLFHLGILVSVLHGGWRMWFADANGASCSKAVGTFRILLSVLLVVLVLPHLEIRGDVDVAVVSCGGFAYCLAVLVPELLIMEGREG